MDALSLYIRANDVTLVDYSNKLVRFYEDNLLPCESFQEFWDVAGECRGDGEVRRSIDGVCLAGMNDLMPFDDEYLAAVILELKDSKQ